MFLSSGLDQGSSYYQPKKEFILKGISHIHIPPFKKVSSKLKVSYLKGSGSRPISLVEVMNLTWKAVTSSPKLCPTPPWTPQLLVQFSWPWNKTLSGIWSKTTGMGPKINLLHTCAMNVNDNPVAAMCFAIKEPLKGNFHPHYTIRVAYILWPKANSSRKLAGSISAAVFGEKAWSVPYN